MKKFLILLLLLSFCTQQTSTTEEIVTTPPEIYINCNFANAPDTVVISIDISIFSNSEKLINGSIKGSGIAENFYKALDDIDKNTSFTGEYVYTTLRNGTFSFILYFDGSKPYRVDCSDKISSIITATIAPKQSTTTTTKPKQTTTTTTTTTKPRQTTTTTLPYVNYRTYDLDALRLFLEVGWVAGDKLWRFEPQNFAPVKIYSSSKANTDSGLDELLKTIPYKYSVLDIPLIFEYVEDQEFQQEGSAEFWYTNDGFTHPDLLNGYSEKPSCSRGQGYFLDQKYIIEEQRITSIQVAICITGSGFGEKKSFIQDSLMWSLGFARIQTGSEFQYYGGYLQPKYIKYREEFNDLDRQLIQILYDPRVFRGMTKEEFKEVFQLP